MKKLLLILAALVVAIPLLVAVGCNSDEGNANSMPKAGDFAVPAPLGEEDRVNQAMSPNNSQQPMGVWVSGEGKVSAIPDIAVLSLGVEAQEMTVAQAQLQARQAMGEIMEALSDNGVAERDIKTQRFSIDEVWNWRDEERVFEGYRVTNMVTAKIRDLENAGPIIDAVAEAGGDLTRINNLYFTIDDPTPHYTEARLLAMQDAMAKAQQMAQIAGVTLGTPTYIAESGGYIPPPRPMAYDAMGMAEAAPAPTRISPGETEISLTVQMVYTIQ
jgi:uncharacterized protein YggE